MGVSRTITSLRKLGHFLAALFPSLAAPWDRLADAAHRRLDAPLARLRSPRGRVIADLVRDVYWSDVRRDRADLGRLDPVGARLLRPLFLASAAACVALPLALLAPGPTLPAGAVDGAAGPVPIASVLLWLVALPLAWGRILAGAAASNRAALVAVAVPYLYFNGLAAVGLPPSAANLFAPTAALVALGACERARPAIGRSAGAAAATTALTVGSLAGVAMAAFTPLGAVAHGHKLALGVTVGAALGAAALASGRALARRDRARRVPVPIVEAASRPPAAVHPRAAAHPGAPVPAGADADAALGRSATHAAPVTGDARTHADALVDSDALAGADALPHADALAGADALAHADALSGADALAGANALAHADALAGADALAHADALSGADALAHANALYHADALAHSDALAPPVIDDAPPGAALAGSDDGAAASAFRAGPGLVRLAALCGGLTFAHLGLVVARGGLARFADDTTPLVRLLVGYLWPAWYFIGVGAIFGLLKSARRLTDAARVLAPPRWFVPLALALLAAVALVLAGRLSAPLAAAGAPAALLRALLALDRLGMRWLWSGPAALLSVEWMRWVVLLDVVAVAWLAARRRLDSESVAWLLWHTLLAWLVVFEYHAQLSGFGHAGGQSAALLGGFAVWLLWLLHRIALRFGEGDSPRWPSAGRLALLGGALTLVMIAVEARAALGDPHLTDEVFLSLFRGVVDVGLPYYLYVHAGRRLESLPLAPHQALGAFALGALLTMPLAALDRLVAAGSFAALSGDLARRADALATVGAWTEPPAHAPTVWLVARGLLVVALLVGVAGAAARRARARGRRDAPAFVLLVVAAVATGVASFARSRVDLPFLPMRLAVLLTPDRVSTGIDLDLLLTYLGFALPALALGLLVGPALEVAPTTTTTTTTTTPLPRTRTRALARWAAATAAALVLHLGLSLAWPREEAWLRASGVADELAVGGVALLVALVALAHRRAARAARAAVPPPPSPPPDDATTPAAGATSPRPAATSPADAQPPVVGPRARVALVAAGVVALLAVTARDLAAARVVEHALPGVATPLPLPVAWTREPTAAPGGAALFRRAGELPTGEPSLLAASVEPLDGGDAMALLRRLVTRDAPSLPSFRPGRAARWDRHLPGAVELDFSFERPLPGGGSFPATAATVLLPLGDDRALVLTLVAGADARERLRWDLALAAERLRARAHPP